ncbi:alpha/beta fold hydrolase [Roseomonas terrae]|uniref:Alpha/beta fold hydrolase n=1 Tax=Neoroseomonas terrae TaxID=424799 RepID=A0ABS5EM95_9PROT|nr:alpha/beta fold hydrolase [Neoroseomonas terrae]MBR0652085.1 alpha/beta fold hydrolase [Neoroseomonas terrae]
MEADRAISAPQAATDFGTALLLARQSMTHWIHKVHAGADATLGLDDTSSQPRPEDVLHPNDRIQLLIDRNGRVIHANDAAKRCLDDEGPWLDAASVRAVWPQAEILPTPLRLRLGDRQILLIAKPSPIHGTIMVEEPAAAWSATVVRQVAATFCLTPREADILRALGDGEDIAAIAMQAGRSEGTVRQQVKAILGKLRVGSQAQAVALLLAFAASPDLSSDIHPGGGITAETTTDSTGRRIAFRRFGTAGGAPVLLLHGALFGVGALLQERQVAAALGLDIIAPERPGYGGTKPPSQGADIAAAIVADVRSVLAALGIGRVVVLAHDVGTAAAFRLAAESPDLVAGIVAAPATPPMRGWSQTADMPPSHRVHAWASQHMPRLMDHFISLGIRHVQRHGLSSLPGLVFGGCAHDRDAWLQPSCRASLRDGHDLIMAGSAAGFRDDMQLTNQDWSALACRVDCPAHLLHGLLSRTVSKQAVGALGASLAQGRVEVVAEAGHTLPLTHAVLVLRRVADMAERAAG